VDATSPEPTISPVDGENATAIADGQRDGRAFAAKVEGGPNSNGKATGYLDKRINEKQLSRNFMVKTALLNTELHSWVSVTQSAMRLSMDLRKS
jgi:hypothetical protein